MSGSLSMPAWSEYLGLFMKPVQLHSLTTSTPSGGTTSRLHVFMPGDATAAVVADALSVQAQYSATVGVNFLGVAIDKLEIACNAGETAMLNVDWLAKDEAKCGGTWDYDGTTASPVLVASPTYFARSILPFVFSGATLTTGGTVSQDPTTKEVTVSSGTAQAKISAVTFTLQNNLEAVGFLGGPCAGEIVPGERNITFSFDRDLAVADTNFYDEMRAGTQVALQLSFLGAVIESTIRRKLTITLPLVDFDDADWPSIGADKKRKSRTVNATAIQDATLGIDVVVEVIDTQTTY